MVKVPIMEVINMTRMFDRGVAAVSAMLMAVVGVDFRGAHKILGELSISKYRERLRTGLVAQPVNVRPEPRMSTTCCPYVPILIMKRGATANEEKSHAKTQRCKTKTDLNRRQTRQRSSLFFTLSSFFGARQDPRHRNSKHELREGTEISVSCGLKLSSLCGFA
jgi:hypothetical protein